MKFLYRSYHKFLILFVTGVSVISFQTAAQDPVYSHFMFNQLYFNPAFSGNTPYPRFISGYRNQWPGLGNAYINYYASFDLYAEPLGGGIGIGLNRDMQGNGIFSRTGFSVMYSYPVTISGSLSANFGFQAGVVQKNLNGGKVILGDQNPFETTSPEIIPDESRFFPDFSAGASILIKEQYQVNFSIHHLSQSNESPEEGSVFSSPFRFSVQAFTQFPAKKKGVGSPRKRLIWRPGIMAQVQGQSNLIGWGSNVLFSGFTAGIWCRNNAWLSLNTINFLGGYTWSGLSVYYSYEVWVPGNYQQLKNYGAHEVTFIYLFQYNDPRKKMKPIKCPKF